MNDTSNASQVRVEVTLTIDGDWRTDPLKVVAGIRDGARSLDEWQRKAVAAAREQGHTWVEVGAAAGVSRQAAWERFSSD
jgi:hypothetical protein